LEEIIENHWNHWIAPPSSTDTRTTLCASDSSDTLAAGIIFDRTGSIRKSLSMQVSKATHIFIKEALATFFTLDEVLEEMQSRGATGETIRIAIDSTAVRRCFERGYSTNAAVNKLVCRSWDKADRLQATIETVDIASEYNVADCLTLDSERRIREHKHPCDGRVCGERMFRTWEVLHGRLAGRVTNNDNQTTISSQKLACIELEVEPDEDWIDRITPWHIASEENDHEDDDDDNDDTDENGKSV
jgi:hypothetical protein